jgi:hypothetical protein
MYLSRTFVYLEKVRKEPEYTKEKLSHTIHQRRRWSIFLSQKVLT